MVRNIWKELHIEDEDISVWTRIHDPGEVEEKVEWTGPEDVVEIH